MIQRTYNELLEKDPTQFKKMLRDGILKSLLECGSVVVATSMNLESMNTREAELEVMNEFYEAFPNSRDYIIEMTY